MFGAWGLETLRWLRFVPCEPGYNGYDANTWALCRDFKAKALQMNLWIEEVGGFCFLRSSDVTLSGRGGSVQQKDRGLEKAPLDSSRIPLLRRPFLSKGYGAQEAESKLHPPTTPQALAAFVLVPRL